MKSVGDCKPCGLPNSPGVVWETMGRLVSLSRPSNCRTASSLRRGFSFWRVVFLAGLLSSVAQTFSFPLVRSSVPFLLAQGRSLQPSSYLASRGSQVSQGCSALLCKAPFQAFLMGGKCRVIERMNGVSISTQPAGGRAAPPTRGCC